jgi:hypothetical protein
MGSSIRLSLRLPELSQFSAVRQNRDCRWVILPQVSSRSNPGCSLSLAAALSGSSSNACEEESMSLQAQTRCSF